MNYIENMNQLIASRFEVSAEILRNNYYGYLFTNLSYQSADNS